MRARSLCLAGVLLLTGALTQGQTPPAGLLQGETLTLTARSSDHLAGSFVHGGVLIDFDSVRTEKEISFVLRDRQKRLLYQARSDTKTYSLSFAEKGLEATGSINERVVKEGVPPRLEEPKIRGDRDLVRKFAESAEYKTLPWLSRALAANGMTGSEVPASLYLHGIALSSAQVNKIAVPDVAIPPPKVAVKRAPPPCPDQRGDPCRNDCFGMCGPGCTCWKWVCGDCCMHVGCLTHDVTCRLCDCGFFSHAGDCILCYTAISFLGAHPCTVIRGCQTPPKC